MDDGRAAWMCSCLEESGVRARPGTSWEEGTLPRGDRSVLCPCLNWEGGAAWTEESNSKPGEGRPGPRTSDAKATRATEKGVG